MTSTDTNRADDSSTGASDVKSGLTDQARRAGSVLAETAQQVGDQAKETASSLASETGQHLHGYVNQQVQAGADVAARVADAIRAAADELDRSSPMLGSAIRGAGQKVDNLSHHIRNKTADEVVADTRDFVQRKPALVFGVAAAFGFVAYRLLNATQAFPRAPSYARTGNGGQRPSNASLQSGGVGYNMNEQTGRGHAD
jgi:ElaB/YqjD/DUF883 family membrane-anchored ribosome-binding protein